jgi:hypothetical protein
MKRWQRVCSLSKSPRMQSCLRINSLYLREELGESTSLHRVLLVSAVQPAQKLTGSEIFNFFGYLTVVVIQCLNLITVLVFLYVCQWYLHCMHRDLMALCLQEVAPRDRMHKQDDPVQLSLRRIPAFIRHLQLSSFQVPQYQKLSSTYGMVSCLLWKAYNQATHALRLKWTRTFYINPCNSLSNLILTSFSLSLSNTSRFCVWGLPRNHFCLSKSIL